MHVAIAGGHGKIALLLTRLLADRGDLARGLIRDPGHERDVEEAGGVARVIDMEGATPEVLAAAIEGTDAVVFAAGAGPGSGAERKETVDYGAAVKLIEAARLAGISRYLMVSAQGADPDAPGDEVFAVYLRAKGRADRELAAAGLDHTIVKPVGLTDDPGTGLVGIGEEARLPQIPRADVAAMLAELLLRPETAGKEFKLSSGPVPMSEAVRRLAEQ